MATSRPIVAAVATACMLQACAAPPTPPLALRMAPVLQLRDSADQTAATYYQLGKYHLGHGSNEQARAAYVQSIGLDRRQIEARNALAVLDSSEGKLDDARRMLAQLVRDHPRIAYLHNNLAYVHLLRGEPDLAIPALEQALALEPGNARALNNLGLVQAALIERRDRLSAALGSANVIAGKAGGPAEVAPANVVDAAATGTLAAAAPATLPALPPLPEPPALQSSMEVVQILPNVIELRQRPAVAPVMVNRRPGETDKTIEAGTMVSAPPRSFRFDVANGNGISGMALKMRDALVRLGIRAGRVSNQRPFNTQSTEIQYLAGYEKEAERVRTAMATHVTMTPVSSIAGGKDVRLLLGKDGAGNAALSGEANLVAYHGRPQ